MSGATRISPGSSSSKSCGPRTTRTMPLARPGEAGVPDTIAASDGSAPSMPDMPSISFWSIGWTLPTKRGGSSRACSIAHRAASGDVDARRRIVVERHQHFVPRQEEDVVGPADDPASGERLAHAGHRASHDRPRDRQLGHLLLAQRDQVLGIGQEPAERAEAAWRGSQRSERGLLRGVPGLDQRSVSRRDRSATRRATPEGATSPARSRRDGPDRSATRSRSAAGGGCRPAIGARWRR